MSAPLSRDPEAVQRLLQERAEALARPLEAEERTEMVGTVGLAVADTRYAVELHHVLGIEHRVRLTPVPGTPAIWAGLANVRGAMYPVLDLRAYLQLTAPADAPSPGTLVLVAAGGPPVGLLCDDASDVTWVRRPDIAAAPRGGRTVRGVLRGITPDMVALLNLEALLSDPALAVDDGV